MTETHNLSLREAATRLGVAPLTLRRMAVYQHRLPYLKVGRKLLFRRQDLEAFELGCLVTGGRAFTVRQDAMAPAPGLHATAGASQRHRGTDHRN